MTQAPVRIGFLGGGMMSQVGHLPFYLGDPRCEVIRIAESRPSLINALRKELGPTRVVSDHGALFADPTVQAIVISMPRGTTGPLTLGALEAGKHVLSEKPMAHSVEQAQRLVKAAKERGLIYAIGFMKRYDPGVRAAKILLGKLIADGTLGRLLLARFYDFSNAYVAAAPPHVRPKESRAERLPTWPLHPAWLPERYQGVYSWFLNAASHDVNLVHFFFQRQLEVLSAHCLNDGGIVAMLRCDDIPIALEITKSVAGQWLEGAEFLFERGRVLLTIPSPMATQRVGEVIVDDQRRGVVGEHVAVDHGWSFARQANGFIDALLREQPPLTSGEEGLEDMKLIEQIWQRVAA